MAYSVNGMPVALCAISSNAYAQKTRNSTITKSQKRFSLAKAQRR